DRLERLVQVVGQLHVPCRQETDHRKGQGEQRKERQERVIGDSARQLGAVAVRVAFVGAYQVVHGRVALSRFPVEVHGQVLVTPHGVLGPVQDRHHVLPPQDRKSTR